MTTHPEGLPILPHQAGEFYAWLWWASECNGGCFALPDPVGAVELWVDERLAFRNPNESKVTAVMTGDSPSTTMEARAALAGGKVLQELRLHLTRDDREYTFTLKGPAMDFGQVKLPQALDEGEEALFDRMFMYEELCLVVSGLFQAYGQSRTSPEWNETLLPSLRRWVLAKEPVDSPAFADS